MANLMLFIQDQIRDVHVRVSLDVDKPIEQLVNQLVQQFGLPRYDFSRRPISYWLERPNGQREQGQRLADDTTLRAAGIRKGDLLWLASPEGRRVWLLVQKIVKKILSDIEDRVTDKLKEKVTKAAWKRIKKEFEQIEQTRTDDPRIRRIRQWIDWVDVVGPLTIIDVVEKVIDLHNDYKWFSKVFITAATLLILAGILQPLFADVPIALPQSPAIETDTPTALLQPTIAVATLAGPWQTPTPSPTSTATTTPIPTPTATATLSPTSPPTVTPTWTATPVVNRAPIAEGRSVAIRQDETINISLIAFDPDGDGLLVSIVSNPANGTLSGQLPNVVYTPNRGFSGFDSFTFKANDSWVDSNVATVNITVEANRPPVANDDAATTEQNQAVSIPLLANDNDPDGASLRLISVTAAQNGAVSDNGDGSVRYLPNSGFSGQDRFSYTISDDRGATASATVAVAVNAAMADLAASQSDSPDPVTVEGLITYEIVVTNHGPAAATNIKLVDTLSPAVRVESAAARQGDCSQSAGTITCDLGSLGVGDSTAVVVRVITLKNEQIFNTVEVTSSEADPDLSNNTSAVETTVTLPEPPDLVVSSVQVTGLATLNSDDRIEVPIRVVVSNRGDEPAGVFKVSTNYTGSNGSFLTPFTMPGQLSIWYPLSNGTLAPGKAVTFNGAVTFNSELQGEVITLQATADSCSGEEFAAPYCRVEEGNEGNNVSQTISVPLVVTLPPVLR